MHTFFLGGGAKLTRTSVLRVCCSLGGDPPSPIYPVPNFYPKLLPILKWHQAGANTRALSTSHVLFFDVKVSVRSSLLNLCARVVGCLLLLKECVYFNGNENNSNMQFLKLTHYVIIFALSSSEAKNLSFLGWFRLLLTYELSSWSSKSFAKLRRGSSEQLKLINDINTN